MRLPLLVVYAVLVISAGCGQEKPLPDSGQPAVLAGRPCERICFEKLFSKGCVWLCEPDEEGEKPSPGGCGNGVCTTQARLPGTEPETPDSCPADCDCTAKGRLLRALRESTSLTIAEDGPTHFYGVIQYEGAYKCVVFTVPQLLRPTE